MGWLFLLLGLALGTQIWLCFRVGRSNVALAVITFFVGFPGAFYTFIKHRDNAETSVTVPFVANMVFSLLSFASVWLVLLPRLDALNREFELSVAPAPMSATASAPVAPAAPASAELMASVAASGADAAAPVGDSVETFSAALREGGLKHTVTRLPASANLPAGVSDAALFSVLPLSPGATPAASAASAGSGNELSATLFKCESAHACRNLAGAYLQQTGDEKRRVLQNGLLLLSLPPTAASDADLTPTAVASVFRKLSL